MDAQSAAHLKYAQQEEERINNFILELAEHEGYDLRPPPKNPDALRRSELHAMRHFRTTVHTLLVKHGLVFA